MDNCPISNKSCSNPKNIQYTMYNNGYMTNYEICQNCTGFCQIKDILFNSCSSCGLTLAELQNHGKVGCANCYTQFKFFIDTILKKCQDDTIHYGKKPSCLENMNFHQIVKIMDEAISKENYELAQKCKEMISQRAKTQHLLDQ